MFPFLLLSALTAAAPLGPVVDIGYATFLGNDSLPSVHFYGGIPYAKPPLGDLRFRAPVRLDESGNRTQRTVTDARNWGPLCIQQPAVVGIGSEGLS